MIAQLKSEKIICSHCLERRICDCESCGQKAWYISFGGKMHKYIESGKCKVCGGKGFISEAE